MADLNLTVVTRLYPWSFNGEDDVLRYICHLTNEGGHISSILSSTAHKDHVIADLIYLIEFEKNTSISRDNKASSASLLYEIVKEALGTGNQLASQVIGRLYVRGFLKELVNAVLHYFTNTVHANVQLKPSHVKCASLQKSHSTVVICSHVLRALDKKVELACRRKIYFLQFMSIRDYNLALSVIMLFFTSVVVGEDHTNLVQLFHPRSPTCVPLKLQLLIIEVMAICVSCTDKEECLEKDCSDALRSKEMPKEGLPVDCNMAHSHKVQPCKVVGPVECFIRKDMFNLIAALLKALSVLWAERDDGFGTRIDYISIASSIVKLLGTLCKLDSFESRNMHHISTLLTEGVSQRLASFNADMNTAAMCVAYALAKWETKRNQNSKEGKDDSINLEPPDVPDREPVLYLLAADAPIVVVTGGQSKACVEPNALHRTNGVYSREETTAEMETPNGKKKVNPDLPTEKDNVDGNHRDDINSDALLDEIFKDVKVPEFLESPQVTTNCWTDPPNHIQQCYERLGGTAVIGDVEPAKMFNREINTPREMKNALKREMILQTLFYLPSVIERNEPILSRFAVPVAQLLLNLQDLDQYEDSFDDIRKKLKVGMPVMEEGASCDPFQIFADEHGEIDLATPQHLVYAGLLCLAVRRPNEVFEYFCNKVSESECSITQRVTMLLCMQCAAKRLCKQKSYRELSRHMLTNVQYLKPLTSPKDYLVKKSNASRKVTPSKVSVIRMPWNGNDGVTPIRLLPSDGFLIRASENQNGCKKYSETTDKENRNVSPILIEELDNCCIHPVDGNRDERSGISNPTLGNKLVTVKDSPLVKELTVNVSQKQVDVNNFAPLANMAISHILKTAEIKMKREMPRMGSTPESVVSVGVLETLYVFLQCSDGRIAPNIIDECKQMVAAAYDQACRTEMVEMLERLIDYLDSTGM